MSIKSVLYPVSNSGFGDPQIAHRTHSSELWKTLLGVGRMAKVGAGGGTN